MYVELSYYCPKCKERKKGRFGNKGLPAESLRFQIEVSGLKCPACGAKIPPVHPEDYYIIED
jgi:DNA-directed RNA polymerase subunit RPC12/RpoP